MATSTSSNPDLVRQLDHTIDECVQAAWRAYRLYQQLRERGVPVPDLPHAIQFAMDIDLENADHSADEPFWWAMLETQGMFEVFDLPEDAEVVD